MPMPFSTLTHINLWALQDGDGWAIVDTGLQSEETFAAWGRLFTGALGGKPIKRVFVTHMHPDHIGMSGWLTRKFDCRLWMTRLEYLSCRTLFADTGREAPADGIRFYKQAGWTEDAIEHYRARFGNFGKMIYKLPDSYRRLVDSESLKIGEYTWQVVVGSGHSPEHACLYCPELKLLISGDQVLPKISSNVSVFPTEPDADPMQDWLLSLEKLKKSVPDDVVVLPAHDEPFEGLHARLDYLLARQRSGLKELHAALETPQRAVDVFSTLFSRPVPMTESGLLNLATGESLAHLNYLIQRGEAIRSLDETGVAWYRQR